MKILHWYHDIMNLYGEYANVSAMERILIKSGEEVVVDRLSFGEQAQLSDYDFIYVGSGTEKNLKYVLKDMLPYREAIRAYIASGKPLLMTGNSFEMLGKSFTDGSGKEFETLGLYDYTTAEVSGVRQTADIICKTDFLDQPLVGFINKSDDVFGITNPLFQIEFGIGDRETCTTEGVHVANFFGTHLIGPILMKNPHFLTYLAALILGREPETAHLGYERKGYEVTLKKLRERAQSSTQL